MTIADLMEDRVTLDGVLMKCNENPAKAHDDPECLNARIAIERLASANDVDPAVEQKRKEEFERRREQLRLAQEKQRQAEEAKNKPFDPYSLPVMPVDPPASPPPASAPATAPLGGSRSTPSPTVGTN